MQRDSRNPGRYMYRLLTFLMLLTTWMIFSGLFDAFHLTLGVISAAFVTWISSDLLFTDRSRNLSQRVREAVLLVPYLVWLFYQIVLANIYVLKLALLPHGMRAVRPRMIRMRTELQTEFAKWLLANSITLTPGTITVRVEGQHLTVHAISAKAAEGLGEQMETKIMRIFEPEKPGA